MSKMIAAKCWSVTDDGDAEVGFRFDEAVEDDTDEADDERGADGRPEAGDVEARQEPAHDFQHGGVDDEGEEAEREDVEWEGEEQDEWAEIGVYHGEQDRATHDGLPGVDLNAGKQPVHNHEREDVNREVGQKSEETLAHAGSSVLPLDGAADGVGEGIHHGLAGEHGGNGLAQIVGAGFVGMLPVVVHTADVADLKLGIEDIGFGRILGAVSVGDALGHVAQIGEVELVVFGVGDHAVETVFGVAGRIVGIDGDELDGLVGEVVLEGDEPGGVGLRVGTMIAGEDDDNGALSLVGCQRAVMTVHAR